MIDLKKTHQIMGIVNTTPDSFSDGGSYATVEAACQHAQALLRAGADILDIGGQSTRPGYQEVAPEIECARVIPVIEAIRRVSDAPISVDTYFPEVAEAAICAGATMINDIKGLESADMAALLARYPEVQVVIMHSRPRGPRPLAAEIHAFYEEKIQQCQQAGILLENICFDPGLGFGKNVDENLAILREPDQFRYRDFPLLYGISRKRTIGFLTDEEQPQERDFGSIAASLFAAEKGVEIVRVHNVKGMKQALDVWQQLKK